MRLRGQVRDDTVVHVWKWWWPVLAGDDSSEEASRSAAAEASLTPAEASGEP